MVKYYKLKKYNPTPVIQTTKHKLLPEEDLQQVQELLLTWVKWMLNKWCKINRIRTQTNAQILTIIFKKWITD